MSKEFVLLEGLRHFDSMIGALQNQKITDCSMFLDALTQYCVDRFDAVLSRVWLVDAEDKVLVLKSSSGAYTRLDGSRAIIPIGGGGKIDVIYTSGEPHITNDAINDPDILDKEWVRRDGIVSFAGYPLVWAGEKMGVLGMFSRQVLPEDELVLIRLFTRGVSSLLYMCQQTERNIRYFCEVTGFRRSLLEQLIRLGQKNGTA